MDAVQKIPEVSKLISNDLKNQISGLFSKMKKEICLKVILDYNDEKSMELGSFVKVISSCSDKIKAEYLERDENLTVQKQLNGEHLPVVGIYGEDYLGVCFHGVPGGKEINTFLAAVCYASGAASRLDEKLLKQIASVRKGIEMKIYVSLSCHHCPQVAAACQKIAIESPYITADVYDAALYPDIVEKYKIERVPMVIINEKIEIMGQKNAQQMAEYLLNV